MILQWEKDASENDAMAMSFQLYLPSHVVRFAVFLPIISVTASTTAAHR